MAKFWCSGSVEATTFVALPYAELADVVSGARPGRESDRDIIVFDSTGTALEDVAAASLVYERAVNQHKGFQIDLKS